MVSPSVDLALDEDSNFSSKTGTHFLTVGHDLHRQRRKPLEPFFSRSGVSKLEPIVHDVAAKLADRFEALKGSGYVIRVNDAFSSFAGDVMSKVCCESSTDFLEEKNFSPQWYVHILGRDWATD